MRILLLFILLSSNFILAQKNEISLEVGPVHVFFDGAPVMNFKSDKDANGNRPQMMYNSYLLEYARQIDSVNGVFTSLSWFYAGYDHNSKDDYYDGVLYPVNISSRQRLVLNAGYFRKKEFETSKFSFRYGTGLSFIFGNSTIYLSGHSWFTNVIGYSHRDLAANVFFRSDYQFTKWLSGFAKVDFQSILYFGDREDIKEMRLYNITKWPSRFDLSFRFGLAFKFGKK